MPKNFDAISNVLANYDFVDIVSGTGIINLYAGNTVDIKLLSNSTFYSDVVSVNGAQQGQSYGTLFDYDFDVVLNRPLNVAGKIVVNTSSVQQNASSRAASFYFDITLRKWDGATETDIATNTSAARNGAAVNTYLLNATDLDIPLTHFKKGETLRLSVKCTGKLDAGAAGENLTVYLGCDPKNRSAGWDTTGAVPSTLIFQLPVRLNL